MVTEKALQGERSRNRKATERIRDKIVRDKDTETQRERETGT